MVNNLLYEYAFDTKECSLLFKRLSSVYGESFELEALGSIEKCPLI
jgi:hypothetical protein